MQPVAFPPAGPPGYPPQVGLRPPPPPHPTLPMTAAWGAVVCTAIPLILAPLVVGSLESLRLPLPAFLALVVVASYGPAIAWWWVASGRYGTGRRRDDVGLILRPADLGWGPLTWLACLSAQVLVGAIVMWAGVPFTSNTEGLGDRSSDGEFVLSVVVLAVVVAPVVEEIVFRGLVMRGLLRRFAAPTAIGIQAALFGIAHVDPSRGSGNAGLVIVLTTVGVVLGGAAYAFRRISASIIAHSILNAAALAAVFLDLSP